MAEITMPKLSDTMTEGTLVAWKKKAGDKVFSGDVIADVETDKATMEMEAFEDGVLVDLVPEGTKVSVGEKIASIQGKGETATAKAPAAPASVAAEAKQPVPVVEKEAASTAAPAPVQNGQESATANRIKASPLAKKVAAAQGIPLGGLIGSGPGGRIVQKDVLSVAPSGGGQAKTSPTVTPAAAAAPSVANTPAPAAKPAAPVRATLPQKETRIPLSGMRKTIAERLLQSKTTIPHFYLHTEVDAAALTKLRAEVNAAGEKDGTKVSVNDFILRATAAAIARVPKVNASFAGDSVVEYSSVNLAVAVAVEDGLVTPVIRDAHLKSLSEISLEVKDLAGRARSTPSASSSSACRRSS